MVASGLKIPDTHTTAPITNIPQPPTELGFLNTEPMMKPSGSTANRPRIR